MEMNRVKLSLMTACPDDIAIINVGGDQRA